MKTYFLGILSVTMFLAVSIDLSARDPIRVPHKKWNRNFCVTPGQLETLFQNSDLSAVAYMPVSNFEDARAKLNVPGKPTEDSAEIWAYISLISNRCKAPAAGIVFGYPAHRNPVWQKMLLYYELPAPDGTVKRLAGSDKIFVNVKYLKNSRRHPWDVAIHPLGFAKCGDRLGGTRGSLPLCQHFASDYGRRKIRQNEIKYVMLAFEVQSAPDDCSHYPVGDQELLFEDVLINQQVPVTGDWNVWIRTGASHCNIQVDVLNGSKVRISWG